MDLVKQVTSVELSNTLKQAGVTTPSLFFRDWTGSKEDEIEMNEGGAFHNPDNVNCFTVAELGEEIKKEKKFKGMFFPYVIGGNWTTTFRDNKIIENNEAEARGKMYLWLLTEGYIKGE